MIFTPFYRADVVLPSTCHNYEEFILIEARFSFNFNRLTASGFTRGDIYGDYRYRGVGCLLA